MGARGAGPGGGMRRPGRGQGGERGEVVQGRNRQRAGDHAAVMGALSQAQGGEVGQQERRLYGSHGVDGDQAVVELHEPA